MSVIYSLYFYFFKKVKMRIDIITVQPELLESPLNHSIVKRAKEKGLVEINIINLRDFTTDKYRSVDDYAFGGGAGMVMMIEPVYKAIEKLKSERDYDEIIYTSPDGEQFSQKMANQLSMKNNIIILAGHYKGVDQRIRDYLITKEISIGDYVLSGGELPAAAITDAIVRLIPGALSDEQSALSDSFQDDLLAPPVFTRPSDFKGWKVPDILLSGNTGEIDKWRHEQSLERTKKLRPNLSSDE
jgi:tRNA (guanine37-N1)-methyltransferase